MMKFSLAAAPPLGLAVAAAVLSFFAINNAGLVGAASPEVGTVHEEVVHLTDDNFNDMVTDPANGLWFLKFYAPWCGHCKKMAPMLDKIAPYMKGKMAVGKIDCTVHESTCKRFDIRGYPTLKMYRDGAFFDFPGERDADSIIEFGEKMAADPVVLVEDTHVAALRDVAGTDRDGIAFVAYDPDAGGGEGGLEGMLQSTKMLQVFKQVARKQQAVATFALLSPTMSKEEVAKFGAGNKAFIAKIESDVDTVIFKSPAGAGDVASVDVLAFVKENNHALVTTLGANNFRSVATLGKPLAIGVYNPDESQKVKSDALLAEIRGFAKSGTPAELRSKYNFCWMDGKKWERFLKQFGIGMANLPEVFVLDFEGRRFWQEPEVAGVREFLEGVESGDIPAREQDDVGGGGPLGEFVAIFKEFMPWSVLVIVLIFGVSYLVFLPGGVDEGGEVSEKKDK